MATEADSRALWRMWTNNELSAFKEKWIAFRNGEVIANGPSLSDLTESYSSEIADGKGPLFAFITLEVLQ